MPQPENLNGAQISAIQRATVEIATQYAADHHARRWCVEQAIEACAETNMPFDISVAEVIHEFIIRKSLNELSNAKGNPDGTQTLDTKTS